MSCTNGAPYAAADPHVAGRVAGVLGELARCCGAQRAHQAGVEAHQFPVDARSRGAEQGECFGIAADLHADFVEDLVGGRLDHGQAVLAEQLVGGDPAADEGWCVPARIGLAPMGDAPAAATGSSAHLSPRTHVRRRRHGDLPGESWHVRARNETGRANVGGSSRAWKNLSRFDSSFVTSVVAAPGRWG
jgi:hypothetical protein